MDITSADAERRPRHLEPNPEVEAQMIAFHGDPSSQVSDMSDQPTSLSTTQDLQTHTYLSLMDVIDKLYSEQLARFGSENSADVFLAIHMSAFDAVIGSMCSHLHLPVQVAAKIAVAYWNRIENEVNRQIGKHA